MCWRVHVRSHPSNGKNCTSNEMKLLRVVKQLNRRSRLEVFCTKGALINFSKLTGKHLCQSLFFNIKVAGLRPNLKKRLWHRCFAVNFANLLRAHFLTKHLWLLFLKKKQLIFPSHILTILLWFYNCYSIVKKKRCSIWNAAQFSWFHYAIIKNLLL